MGLTVPGDARDTTDSSPDSGSYTAASASAYAPAREGSRTAETADEQGGSGEVLVFPRGGQPDTHSDHAPAVSHPRAALEVWTSEAATTAREVWHGSVWHARPASLRDREARVRRAEWSGGIPALAIPGRIYGYVIALPVTVLLRAVEQIFSRPARLLTLALAVLIPLLLA